MFRELFALEEEVFKVLASQKRLEIIQLLKKGELNVRFTAEPEYDFALRLEEQGMKKIATFKDIWGSLYAVGACALTKTVQDNPELAKGYALALRKVVEWMKANPEKAAEMMSKSTGNKVSPANFVKYLKSTTYDSYTQNADLKTQAAAMKAFGAISRVPKGPEDFYAYPAEAGAKW